MLKFNLKLITVSRGPRTIFRDKQGNFYIYNGTRNEMFDLNNQTKQGHCFLIYGDLYDEQGKQSNYTVYAISSILLIEDLGQGTDLHSGLY